MDKEKLLDQLLTELEKGDWSLDELLEEHPEAEGDIASLLLAAEELKAARIYDAPSEFKERDRRALTGFMRAHPRQKVKPQRRTALFPHLVRFAALAASLLLVILISGTALAQSASPGDRLYPWKRRSESVYRAVHPDQTRATVQIAQRRIEELVDADTIQERNVILQGYQQVLENLTREVSRERAEEILPILKRHQRTLDGAGLQMPQLEQAITDLSAAPDQEEPDDTLVPTLPSDSDDEILPTEGPKDETESTREVPLLTIEPTLEVDITEDLGPIP